MSGTYQGIVLERLQKHSLKTWWIYKSTIRLLRISKILLAINQRLNLTLICHHGWSNCIAHNVPEYNSHIEARWGQHETRGTQKCPFWQAERTVGRLCMQSWSEYLCQCSVSFFSPVIKGKKSSEMSVGWWENIWKWESFDYNILDSWLWKIVHLQVCMLTQGLSRSEDGWAEAIFSSSMDAGEDAKSHGGSERSRPLIISISTGFNYAGLRQVNKTCFPKAAQLSTHLIKFMSSHFINKNNPITTQLIQKNIGGIHYSIPSCLSLMATLKRSSSSESSLIRSVMAFVNASC